MRIHFAQKQAIRSVIVKIGCNNLSYIAMDLQGKMYGFGENYNGQNGFLANSTNHAKDKMYPIDAFNSEFAAVDFAVAEKNTCIISIPAKDQKLVHATRSIGVFKDFYDRVTSQYNQTLKTFRLNHHKSTDDPTKNRTDSQLPEEGSLFRSGDSPIGKFSSTNPLPQEVSCDLEELGLNTEVSCDLVRHGIITRENLSHTQTQLKKLNQEETLEYLTSENSQFKTTMQRSKSITTLMSMNRDNIIGPLITEAFQDAFKGSLVEGSLDTDQQYNSYQAMADVILADPDSGFYPAPNNEKSVKQMFKPHLQKPKETFVEIIRQGKGKQLNIEVFRNCLDKEATPTLVTSANSKEVRFGSNLLGILQAFV